MVQFYPKLEISHSEKEKDERKKISKFARFLAENGLFQDYQDYSRITVEMRQSARFRFELDLEKVSCSTPGL